MNITRIKIDDPRGLETMKMTQKQFSLLVLGYKGET